VAAPDADAELPNRTAIPDVNFVVNRGFFYFFFTVSERASTVHGIPW
jgi:hypothetical protein